MLLFGNSGRHVTLKVHARSWLPLQRINILSDAGANCSIFGCGMSRKPKYEGIAIFKIPPSHEKKKKKQQQQQQQKKQGKLVKGVIARCNERQSCRLSTQVPENK